MAKREFHYAVDEAVRSRPTHATDFIVNFLNSLNGPATSAEIRAALRAANFSIKDSSLNWALANLNRDGRIRRLRRGLYEIPTETLLPPTVDDIIKITDATQFRRWAEKVPSEFVQVIASRVALRVLPLAMNAITPDEGSLNTLMVLLRAGYLSWASGAFSPMSFPNSCEFAARKALSVSRLHSISAMSALAHGAYASSSASKAIDSAMAVADYAANSGDAENFSDQIWTSIDSDVKWVNSRQSLDSEAAPDQAAYLANERLWWGGPLLGDLWTNDVPISIVISWNDFSNSKILSEKGFQPWLNWYETRLIGGARVGFSQGLSGTADVDLGVELAGRDERFWDQNALAVNVELSNLIEGLLERSAKTPVEPESGPGPQYSPRDGKLSETHALAPHGETERLAGLHLRLAADAKKLADSLHRAINRYPELAGAAREYAELIEAKTSEIDVSAIWSVGGALASFAQSYREQNVAGTLAEPLEPQLDAQLQNLVRQHGAFVMGFEEGRDLVHRADEFSVDTARLREIEKPGSILLNELTENRDLVDQRTRDLHRPIRDSVTEFGWASSRVGYSAYLIVRNGVRAIIKFSVGENRSPGELLAIMAGVSVLAGDPNAEFIRAAIPILQQHGSQLLAFFNHSPEMRAYVEWALHVLKADHEL